MVKYESSKLFDAYPNSRLLKVLNGQMHLDAAVPTLKKRWQFEKPNIYDFTLWKQYIKENYIYV